MSQGLRLPPHTTRVHMHMHMHMHMCMHMCIMLPHTTRAGATSSALTLTLTLPLTLPLALTLPLTLTRCDQLCRAFQRQIGCNAIHGDKEQRERERVLQEFKDGRYTPLPLRYTSYYITTYSRTAGTPLLLISDYSAAH